MEKELDFSAEIQRDIFGMQDAHVRKIEKELQVSIVSRNGSMKVIGEDRNVEAAVVLLEDMAGLSEHGSEVTSQQVDYALDMKDDDNALSRFSAYATAGLIGAAAGKPLGPKVQERITTDANVKDISIVSINCSSFRGKPAFFVETALDQA